MASMMGTMLALSSLFFGLMILLVAMATSSNQDWETEMVGVDDKSVLEIKFDGPLKDHVTRRDIFSSIVNYDEPPVTGLYELSLVLQKAAKDDRIQGILLRFESLSSGMANAESLRREIGRFKESGKFVISYAEGYGEVDYLIASVSDEVILYPKGFFEWDGLFTKLSYFKNTAKKLEVEPQVFRVGKYKSAIEPFINEKMSEASREQVQALVEGSWSQVVKYAVEKTQKTEEELNDIAQDLEVLFASDALKAGFVNLLASQEEVDEKLKELSGAEEKPNYVPWRRYYREIKDNGIMTSKNKIAVVFAQGGIGTEETEGDGISSRELTEVLTKIRRDEEVKAVVLRVNSPGGSSLASDVIWTSTQWLKDAKPFVTSFGNVAASGGYYISAGSQYIFAEPTTITGSIGVFGLRFATQDFWNKKVGMTFDTYKSHRFSDLQSLVRPVDLEERQKIQNVVETIYQDFLTVVTNGREKFESNEKTHEIAQGRVWIGKDALEIGLVDELGGLNEAVLKAAELASLTDYDVAVYPKPLSPVQQFMKQLNGVSMSLLERLVPETLQSLLKEKKSDLKDQILTRLPFDIVIQ